MRKTKNVLTLLALLCLLPACEGRKPPTGSLPPPAALPPAVSTVYAYGIVEARHHSTLSAKFPGKIEKILVSEGEEVSAGQLLAKFEAKELEAQVEVARRATVVAKALLTEAEAGARRQEILAAAETLKETEAQVEKAQADETRYRQLRATSLVATAEWEQYRLGLASSQARRNAAAQQLKLLEAGTRPETLAVLRQRVTLAAAETKRAEAALANADLTAPYAGVVTRKHREAGEAMDIGLPVMDIATLSDRYVRAEIDETDIGRVAVGQAVQVSADGFPGVVAESRLVEVKQQMGPKKLIPTDPSKIVDYKVLDVEIELPAASPFPIKLPVTVRIACKARE